MQTRCAPWPMRVQGSAQLCGPPRPAGHGLAAGFQSGNMHRYRDQLGWLVAVSAQGGASLWL